LSEHFVSGSGGHDAAIVEPNDMSDAGRQIFGAGGKQNDAKGVAHEALEKLAKMGTGRGIEAGKGFVEEQQARRPAKGAC